MKNTQQLLRVRTIAAQGLSAAKSHPGLRLYSPQRWTACLQIYWQTSAAEGTCLTGIRGLMPSGAQLGETAQTTTAPRLGQTAHRGEKTQDNYPAGACLRLFRPVKNGTDYNSA